jgi:AAA15 family ATPase/GTPase
MLVEFSVANYRSIRERQTFSFVAGTGGEHEETHLIPPRPPQSQRLLRSAAIFGPNASGKTNIVRALAVMRWFVLDSAKEEIARFRIAQFLFDAESKEKPTEFEIIFIHDGIQYQFGFSLNKERVVEEWLYATPPKGRIQKWYTRTYNGEKDVYDWYINAEKLKGNKKVLEESTKKTSLFLSTGAMLNNSQLHHAHMWFLEKLRVIGPDHNSSFGNVTADSCKDEEKANAVTRFLRSADLSIHGISVEYEKVADALSAMLNIPSAIKEDFLATIGGDKEQPKIKMRHKVKGSEETVAFDFAEESRGTQNLFNMAMPWLETLAGGYTLVIDELESSLHTHIIRHLLNMMHSPELNHSGAQLLFTTHNTSLLDKDIFRRDQIWFTEKCDDATRLYSLLEFHPRKEEALEKGYLQGRYGALPMVGALNI